MDSETVMLVGGPLDGQRHEVPVGKGWIKLPAPAAGGSQDTLHRYGQADLFDPAAESRTENGGSRYMYIGEGRDQSS